MRRYKIERIKGREREREGHRLVGEWNEQRKMQTKKLFSTGNSPMEGIRARRVLFFSHASTRDNGDFWEELTTKQDQKIVIPRDLLIVQVVRKGAKRAFPDTRMFESATDT